MKLRNLIDKADLEGIRAKLSNDPSLANIGIPFDSVNLTVAHPLHRLCDGVFEKKYTDAQARAMAEIFLEFGAHVDGNGLVEKQDTPLIAAASLHADLVAFLYLDHGAYIHHAGCHGGTAIHWAAWCGRDLVVKRLIKQGAEINRLCIDFQATPLFWAVHGLKNGGNINRHNQVRCVALLLEAGADKSIANREGNSIMEMLREEDVELASALNSK